jgi:hypothetical protein
MTCDEFAVPALERAFKKCCDLSGSLIGPMVYWTNPSADKRVDWCTYKTHTVR